jgi:hypothetical protein
VDARFLLLCKRDHGVFFFNVGGGYCWSLSSGAEEEERRTFRRERERERLLTRKGRKRRRRLELFALFS